MRDLLRFIPLLIPIMALGIGVVAVAGHYFVQPIVDAIARLAEEYEFRRALERSAEERAPRLPAS